MEWNEEFYNDYLFNLKAVFSITCEYLTHHTFQIKIKVIKKLENYDGTLNLLFFDKWSSESFSYFLTDLFEEYNSTVESNFLLKTEQCSLNIPRIIHQSYKEKVAFNNFKAIDSWKLLNLNWDYRYWNDDESRQFVLDHFGGKVIDAYDSLYAGACKADIFRLCVLYELGGVWCDISSVCEKSLDLLVKFSTQHIFPIDTPSQTVFGSIYQAFLVSIAKSEVIKYILDFTVDRVLNHSEFNDFYTSNYPVNMAIETVSITGPVIFGIGLNKYLKRDPGQFFKSGFEFHDTYLINHDIQLINHNIHKVDGYVFGEIVENEKFISSKYPNHDLDRTNQHYSVLLNNGYTYKYKIEDSVFDECLPTIFQIWIQSRFVSQNMYQAVKTWRHPKFNYKLVTLDSISEIIKKDSEFPGLHESLLKIKPFAFKSDIIRYYLMYRYGGVYSDIDSVCYSDIQELYNSNELVLCSETDGTIFNAFIIAKRGNVLFKNVLNTIIENIQNNFKPSNDLLITGPGILTSEFKKLNLNVKTVFYSRNLPVPNGCWKFSSKNAVVSGNKITAELLNMRGRYIKGSCSFSIGDNLMNVDGSFSGNNPLNYIECEGSGLIYDDTQIIAISKYPTYNKERLILDGNDFAKMFENDEIYN